MARRVLDHAAVVAAAAELANADGAQALTLARLASKLGVKTPSLYNHVDGMPGLLAELELLNAERLGDRLGQAVMGRSGIDALHAIAAAYRDYTRSNPGLYALGLRSAAGDDPGRPIHAALQTAQERAVIAVLRVVESLGLSGEAALHAVRGLRSLVHGFTSLELAGGFGLPLDLDESYRQMIEAFGRGIQSAGDI